MKHDFMLGFKVIKHGLTHDQAQASSQGLGRLTSLLKKWQIIYNIPLLLFNGNSDGICSVAPDIAAALKIKVYHGKNGFLASYSLMENSLV
jgi:hypothetical protein